MNGDHRRQVKDICESISTVFVGKELQVRLLLVGFFSGLHVLIEDIPGVGKTTLARSLAGSVNLDFGRIQFTPDLMPGDVVGMTIWSQEKREFIYKPGAVMHQFVLADEINRTSPRTQSALLEAMEEGAVTVDGTTHILPDPFFVVATQNPQEFYGTYPLPESQLDRFLVRLSIGYPPPGVEREVLSRRGADPVQKLDAVMSATELRHVQQAVDSVKVDDAVLEYLHRIVIATRNTPLLSVGVSTRGALGFERAARARALVEGRSYVLPDDVKFLAPYVLTHRILISPQTRLRGRRPEEVVAEIVNTVPVPVET